MCMAKPGPRCSADTSKDLAAARAQLTEVMTRTPHDQDAINHALLAVEDLQWDWDSTAGGKKELTARMDAKSTSDTERQELRRRIDRGELLRASREAALQSMPPTEPRSDDEREARRHLADTWNDHVHLLRRQQAAYDSGNEQSKASFDSYVESSGQDLDQQYAEWGWPNPNHNRPGDRTTPYRMCNTCGQFSGSNHRCRPERTSPQVLARTPKGWAQADWDTRGEVTTAMLLHGHHQCPDCGQFTGRAGHQCPGARVMAAYDWQQHWDAHQPDDSSDVNSEFDHDWDDKGKADPASPASDHQRGETQNDPVVIISGLNGDEQVRYVKDLEGQADGLSDEQIAEEQEALRQRYEAAHADLCDSLRTILMESPTSDAVDVAREKRDSTRAEMDDCDARSTALQYELDRRHGQLNHCPNCGQFVSSNLSHDCADTNDEDADGPVDVTDPADRAAAMGLSEPVLILGADGRYSPVPPDLYPPDPVLAARTPDDIDGELSTLMSRHHDVEQQLARTMVQLHKLADDTQDVRTREWAMSDEEARRACVRIRRELGDGAVSKAVDDYEASLDSRESIESEHTRLELERERRGGWPRAFLVSNGDGHVHSSMQCGTCRPTTRYHWMTNYSGKTEEEIVADAGVRSCTVCFPSAPVEVLSKPTKMFTPDEEAQQKARAARQAATAERKAKQRAAALTPDGSEFTVRWGSGSFDSESFKTERSAAQWYVSESARVKSAKDAYEAGHGDKHFVDYANGEHAAKKESLNSIVEAIAAKHGRPVDEVQAELDAKVAAKAAKEAREAEKWRKTQPMPR